MLWKAAEVDLREFDTDLSYLWKATEAADLREIDTDLGYLAEAGTGFCLTFVAAALSGALRTFVLGFRVWAFQAPGCYLGFRV